MLTGNIESIVEELIQLLKLHHATLFWLQERQHLSARAKNVLQLHAWILHHFKKCSYDFLHFSYSLESSKDILKKTQPLIDFHQHDLWK
jgi:hypothetical protein